MLELRALPDLTEQNSWDHVSGESIGQTTNYVVWPADDGSKLVTVKINVTAFGDYLGGDGVGMHIGKIKTAFEQHRDYIQGVARQKYRPGEASVTLDVGDFR